ncbi:MAG: hypothetical protein MI784_09770 [Cytophagales bacterium]|nr:hypothetical protein [Cytophagales bacterium]
MAKQKTSKSTGKKQKPGSSKVEELSPVVEKPCSVLERRGTTPSSRVKPSDSSDDPK